MSLLSLELSIKVSMKLLIDIGKVPSLIQFTKSIILSSKAVKQNNNMCAPRGSFLLSDKESHPSAPKQFFSTRNK